MKSQKETNPPPATHGRWYDDACGTAFGLELLGERWSLLIVRELIFGPRRFSDIRAELPGISAKILTERLAGLEASGIVTRSIAPAPTPARLYGLTPWGMATEPIIQELGRWAAASPQHDPTLPLSAASLMMSLRTMLDRRAAAGLTLGCNFAIGAATFTARLEDGALPIRRGTSDGAELSFTAPDAPALAAVIYGGLPPEAAGVTATGEAGLRQRFIDLFNLPPKVGGPAG